MMSFRVESEIAKRARLREQSDERFHMQLEAVREKLRQRPQT